MRAVAVAVACAALATYVVSCAGGNAASQLAKAPEYQPKDQTKCSVEKSQAKPLIVEWPSADRGELEAQAHNRGLVVVRYVGCEMQLLDRCTTPVKYGYAPITRKKDRVTMRDADDLYANVPVGAARLEAKLERSGQLDVDMTLVGRWEAERTVVRLDELQGDCSGATHVMSALTVGSFTFTAGADAEVGGSATVAGAGGGGKSTSKRETLNADGDEAACEKSTPDDKAPPPNCGAMLRVEVVPLGEAKKLTPTCPEGTRWDGSQCMGKKVVTQVDCPAGSKWDGSRCAASVDTGCASGMHFQTGTGCVPNDAVVSRAPAQSRGQETGAALAYCLHSLGDYAGQHYDWYTCYSTQRECLVSQAENRRLSATIINKECAPTSTLSCSFGGLLKLCAPNAAECEKLVIGMDEPTRMKMGPCQETTTWPR
jgi:hypothetical protein